MKQLKGLIFVMALLPLLRLIWMGLEDGLGANPIEKVLRELGYWTLVFLMLTLSVTPLRMISGLIWVGRFRRMLGLFAFFYATLHFSSYVGIDQFFDGPAIVRDIIKRPYITVGFAAFLWMIPLAVTSTDQMIRRLGGQRWRALHRGIYLIAFGGILHFIWLVKKDVSRPLTFALIWAVLLTVRALYRRWELKGRTGTQEVDLDLK